MMTLTCIVLTFLAVNFYKMIYSKEALVAEWIHFYTLWDNVTHYKTESVHFLGLMNSATKKRPAEKAY